MECKHLSVLIVVFLLYLCLGAAIFHATERGAEQSSIAAMVAEYRHFLGTYIAVMVFSPSLEVEYAFVMEETIMEARNIV